MTSRQQTAMIHAEMGLEDAMQLRSDLLAYLKERKLLKEELNKIMKED